MSDSINLVFYGCSITASKTSLTFQLRLSGNTGYKMTLLTMPTIVDSATYGNKEDTTLHLLSHTDKEFDFTPIEKTTPFGVVSNTNGRYLYFPSFANPFTLYPTGTHLYWVSQGGGNYQLYTGLIGYMAWTRITPTPMEGGVCSILFNTNRLYLPNACVDATSNDTVTITPSIFGIWESREDVILDATAPVTKQTTGFPDAPTLTVGKARIIVEPLGDE